MKKLIIAVFFVNISLALCQSISFSGEPELFEPGIVSAENSEVKVTFSKDGNLLLWGSVDKEGNLSILKSVKVENGWNTPEPVSFNSSANDFDPSFSADGKTLYFFSNRSGGAGGDDLYSVKYDSENGSFGEPVNMGTQFNTPGDEWGPAESADGKKFIFCTDGLGGKGKHDVFICEKTHEGWGVPENIDVINSADDDFDPVLLHDNKTILFTQRFNDDEAYLYITFLTKDGYTIPKKVSALMNVAGVWNFGSCINPSEDSYIYYSTRINNNSKGRLDIYRIKYNITDNAE